MMQIFVDAIEKSRIDATQYVLFKSLDMERVSDKRKLLELLKDGWQIMGEYHNGTGYAKYYITDSAIVKSFKKYLKDKIFKRDIKSDVIHNADTVYIHFQIYYEPITCRIDGCNISITFFQHKENQFLHEHFRIENDKNKAKAIKTFFDVFGVKQDNDTLIDLLEKELEVKS